MLEAGRSTTSLDLQYVSRNIIVNGMILLTLWTSWLVLWVARSRLSCLRVTRRLPSLEEALRTPLWALTLYRDFPGTEPNSDIDGQDFNDQERTPSTGNAYVIVSAVVQSLTANMAESVASRLALADVVVRKTSRAPPRGARSRGFGSGANTLPSRGAGASRASPTSATIRASGSMRGQ